MIGYTSCGLGVSDAPLRFNCRGEVSIITLRRSLARDLLGNNQSGDIAPVPPDCGSPKGR
jgi:hypothetical protein